MTSVLSTKQEKFEFVETEVWPYLRPIFIFGRIFGVSYVSSSKRRRIILKCFCGLAGLFSTLLAFRSLFFFKDTPTNELTAETVLKIVFVGVITFGALCWGSALYFQRYLDDFSSILKPLQTKGYREIKPAKVKAKVTKQLILNTFVVFANFFIMFLAGFDYIPFAFYPYLFDFTTSNKVFLIIFTSLSTFYTTGVQTFATTLLVTHMIFVRNVIKQFNQRLADPGLSNPNELCSDHFLICNLKEHVNRIWSVLIFLYDVLFIVLLVFVGFLLISQHEIEYHTKIVLSFWVFLFFVFFLMYNVPAILLNEESEKSIRAVFERVWVQREAKLFLKVIFFQFYNNF